MIKLSFFIQDNEKQYEETLSSLRSIGDTFWKMGTTSHSTQKATESLTNG